MPDTAAGLPIAPLPSATPANCGLFRLCPVTRRLSGCGSCHPQSCRIRLRALPIAPLPSATPASCGPFRLSPLPLLAVEGRRSRETTVRFAWGPPAPCGSGWACMEEGRHDGRAAVAGSARWAGPHGRRRLPGLQGEAGRMAGGGWACMEKGGMTGGRRLPGLQGRIRVGRRPSDPLEDQRRHRVTARSSHGGRPGGESSATRCAVDIFLLILPS